MVLWDFVVHTGRKIDANRPDIIIKDLKEQSCTMLAVTVPADENILLKEFEKLSKYKEFETEVTKMWKLKTKTIPVVISALGMIQKGTQNTLMKYLESLLYKKYIILPDKHCIYTTKNTLSIKHTIISKVSYTLVTLYMPFYLQMSQNINSTTRHLKFSYISILTNLLRTDNETKSVKTICN